MGANIDYYQSALARERDASPCPACGSLNQVWERTCRECGARLEAEDDEEGELGGERVEGGAEPAPSSPPPAELLEQTLIRDLEAVDAAISQLELPADGSQSPCLVRIQGPNPGERFEFEGSEISIGKAAENEVSIPDDSRPLAPPRPHRAAGRRGGPLRPGVHQRDRGQR